MIYLVTGEEILNTYLLGAFSSRDEAEKQKNRLEEKVKERYMISLIKFKIVEIPFNNTEWIDKSLELSFE